MKQPQIEITADGSATLYIPEIDEHYHSVKGALTESLHIFIQTGFHYSKADPLIIFEVGFGTGLNAFLTLLESEKFQRKTVYHTIELYPLTAEQANSLKYQDTIAPEQATLFETIHLAEWDKPIEITPNFTLHKIKGDMEQIILPDQSFDLIYYDAFAPEKQPNLWSEEIFEKISRSMKSQGILTTYCAKGEVRRRLQRAGLIVERLQGPPAGKREILRAIKP